MKRIVSLELFNYQSWAHVIFYFDKGFNALCGETDQGKTAAFRAINWILYNKPSGERFIKHGTKYANGILTFDDGTIIKRYKSISGKGVTKENSYDIIYGDGTTPPLHLEDFGVNVPTEVLIAHGMRFVKLGSKSKSLNIAYQLDASFLLSENTATKANIIGSVAHTTIIDRAIKNTSSDVTSTTKDTKTLAKDIAEKEIRLKEYGYIANQEVVLDRVSAIVKLLDSKTDEISRIRQIVDKLNINIERKNNLDRVMAQNKPYVLIYDIIGEAYEKSKEYTAINNLFIKLNNEETRLADCNLILKSYENIDKVQAAVYNIEKKMADRTYISNKMASINRLETQLEILKKSIVKFKDVDLAIDKINQCYEKFVDCSNIKMINDKLSFQQNRKALGDKIVINLKKELSEAITLYQGAIKEAGKCPICFTEVDEKALANIYSNLF